MIIFKPKARQFSGQLRLGRLTTGEILKDFLERNNIPTAYYDVFTEVNSAIQHVKNKGVPIVIKADGLAAGKGVIIAHTQADD